MLIITHMILQWQGKSDDEGVLVDRDTHCVVSIVVTVSVKENPKTCEIV